MPVTKKPGGKRVYQLKVALRDIRPPVWRRIQVRSDTNLQRLHRIIQKVMGRHESHLHEFDIFRGALRRFRGHGRRSAGRAAVRPVNLVTAEKERFHYVYDFGDSREHEILVEKILPAEEGTRYSVCLTGKRACPPEDCGGPPGYEDLPKILKDPSHPEHERTGSTGCLVTSTRRNFWWRGRAGVSEGLDDIKSRARFTVKRGRGGKSS